MTQAPKKQPNRTIEAHIYMTPTMKAQLERAAAKACRSVNGQILYYVQAGLAQEGAK